MRSTSSTLTLQMVAEYCDRRLASVFPADVVQVLQRCLLDFLDRKDYPPYRSGSLDVVTLAELLSLDVGLLRTKRASLKPIFDAVCRAVAEASLWSEPVRGRLAKAGKVKNAPRLHPAQPDPSIARRRPGRSPKPIIEFPEPLEITLDEPVGLGAALKLPARRHGETVYHLYEAVVRPEDGVNRSTLIRWARGKKLPRAAISREILGRIERRYRSPEGYFAGKAGSAERAAGDFDLEGIGASERRRLAWQLPDDFNRRPKHEQAEILD